MSCVTRRRFASWYLGKYPERQIITATYSSDFSEDHGRDVRKIVESPEYQNVFTTTLAQDSRAAGNWTTAQDGRSVATGVLGPLTGRGAHVALLDDPIKNRAAADSEAERENVWRWYVSTFYTRPMPGGSVIAIGTMWHCDDLLNRLLQQDHENWEVIKLKAINDAGEALWGAWYPIEELEKIRMTLGPREFEALYQQSPTLETGVYFQRPWFEKRYEQLPKPLSVYVSTDFAVSAGSGDFTELCALGEDSQGDIYILDWWSGQTTLDKSIEAPLDLCEKWKPRAVFGESGVIRRAAKPFLQRRMRERHVWAMFEWITRTADKEAHARSIQARASMNKVKFPKKPWGDRVIEQLIAFPTAKYDDAVDTLALIGMSLDKTHAPAQLYRRPPPRRGTTWMSR